MGGLRSSIAPHMSPSWPRLVGSLQSVSRCLGLLADECTERDIPSLTEIVGTVSSIYGDLEKFHPGGGNVGGRSRSTTLVVGYLNRWLVVGCMYMCRRHVISKYTTRSSSHSGVLSLRNCIPVETGAICSSVVRAFTHGAMGRQIDPS